MYGEQNAFATLLREQMTEAANAIDGAEDTARYIVLCKAGEALGYALGELGGDDLLGNCLRRIVSCAQAVHASTAPVAPLTGPQLRAKREYQGFKQRELAALVGISQVSVSRWERNQYTPTRAELLKMHAVLG